MKAKSHPSIPEETWTPEIIRNRRALSKNICRLFDKTRWLLGQDAVGLELRNQFSAPALASRQIV
jgi:hypothetical protein